MSEKHLLAALMLQIMNERETASHSEISEGAHPARDPEFLEEHMAGTLSAEKLHEYHEHLAQCPLCRAQMALHAWCGTLEIPQDGISTGPRPSMTFGPASVNRRMFYPLGITAACCGLALLCVTLFMSEHSMEKEIADAVISPKAEVIEPSEPENSLEYPEAAEPSAPEKSQKHLDAASTGSALPKSQNQEVLSELQTLVLPEDRPEELTLAALGFRVNGLDPAKGILIADPRLALLAEKYRSAIAVYPENAELILEYAAFLLFTVKAPEEAESVLGILETRTLGVQQERDFAKLKALTLFTLRRFDSAVSYFEKAFQVSSAVSDKLDLATALYAAGKKEKAFPLFRELESEVTDPEKLRQIQRILDF